MSVGLLEKESTGGDTARNGFEYQDAYVLQTLPEWLGHSGFSHIVSEAVGDVEVCYFHAEHGSSRLMLEAKGTVLTAPQFWDEIQRFKDAHASSPSEFARFGLVCQDFNSKTSPFVEKLRRLRGVGSSYHSSSPILEQDRAEVLNWAKANGHPVHLAEFALQHVDFVRYSAGSADTAFPGEVTQHLPSIDLSGKQAIRLRDHFKAHIARSSSGPVHRRELEADICAVLGEHSHQWLETPLRVNLGERPPFGALHLEVSGFNGPDRAARSQADWDVMRLEAASVASFIERCTVRRGVVLDGKQRMSTACVLGHEFTAARGFTLRVEHNAGIVFRTDRHEKAPGPFFNTLRRPGDGRPQGVVCVGFPTPVGADAWSAQDGLLVGLPALSLESARAIASNDDMNLAIAEAKTAMVQFRTEGQLQLLHLFIKAPSAFSMLLGHRLNGICKVQLYDWVDGRYRATALLDA